MKRIDYFKPYTDVSIDTGNLLGFFFFPTVGILLIGGLWPERKMVNHVYLSIFLMNIPRANL